MLRFRRATVAVLILMSFWPTLVFGQAPSKAGVVTTLEGRASATRVVLPNPVALHFKDDVFLNDEITTAEKSLARILLGGKAVVTVRERSSLTITEVPGLSTIDIASGKIAMAVARERLRPGEQIQIRTPNAITGIRGTSLIVEVIRSIADTKRPDPNAITRLGVFNGNVDVLHINPITKAPLAPAVNVAVNTKFSAAGTQPAAVAPFSPGDAASFQQGVTPAGPQHVQAANEQQLAGQAQETANALLTALGTGAVVAPPLTPTPASPVDTRPELNDDPDRLMPVVGPQPPPPPPPPASTIPSNIVIDPELQAFMSSPVGTSVVAIPAGSGEVETDGTAFTVQPGTPVPADLNVPLLTVTDGDLTVNGQVLDILGTFSSTTAAPLVSLDPTVTMVTGDFLRVAPTGDASVGGALLSDVGGTLTVGGNLINVAGGALRSTGPDALIQLNGTTLNVGGSLLTTTGSGRATPNVTIDGSLVRAVDSTLRFSGLPTAPGTGTLPSIFEPNFGSIITTPNVGRSDDSAGSIALGFAFPFRGQTFSSVEISSNGFVSLGGTNGNACCDGNVGQFLNGAARIAAAWYDLDPRFGGGLKFNTFPGRAVFTWDAVREFGVATSSNTLQLQLLADGRIIFGYGGVSNVRHSLLVGITPGGEANDPGATNFLSGGSFSTFGEPTVYEFFGNPQISGGAAFDLSGSNLVFTPNELGGWDVSTTAVIGFSGSMLALVNGSIVNQTGSDPFIDLVRTGIIASELLQISGGSTLNLGGTLLRSEAGGLAFSADLVRLSGDGARLTSGSLDPLLAVSGGTLRVGGRLLGLDNGATVATAAGLTRFTNLDDGALRVDGIPIHLVGASSLSVGGPVLDMTNTDLALGARPLVRLDGGSRLVVTGGPAVRLSGGSLSADALLTTDGSRNTIDISGILLDLADNATVTLNRLGESAELPILRLGDGQPLVRASNSTLSMSGNLLELDADPVTLGGGALLQFAGSTVTTGGSLFSLASEGSLTLSRGVLEAANSTLITGADGLIATGAGSSLTTLGTTAPLLRFTGTSSAGRLITASGSTLDVASSLVNVGAGSTLTVSTAAPGAALQLTGTSVESGSDLVFVAGSLQLDRGLIDALGSPVLTRDGAVVTGRGGAHITTAGTSAPLLRFTGTGDQRTTVTADDNFIALAAAPPVEPPTLPSGVTVVADIPGPGPAPSMTLSGPLLTATLADLANGDVETNARAFLSVSDGARLVSTSGQPLLSLDRSSLTTTGSAVSVRRSAPLAQSALQLAGPLLATQDSEIVVFSTALRDAANGPRLCCSLLAVGQGGRLTSTTSSPLIDLLRTTVSLGDRFAVVFDTTSIFGEAPFTMAGAMNLAGPLARVVGGSVDALEDFLGVFRSSLDATTTAPLITLDGTSVTLGGRSPINETTVAGRLLNVAGSASTLASLNIAGPLLSATGTTIETTDDVFGVFGGGRLVSTTSLPLIATSGGSVTTGDLGSFFVMAAAAGLPAPIVSLQGGLLNARGTTFVIGDPEGNAQTFAFVGDGTRLSATTQDALLDLERTTVRSGTLMTVRRPGAAPTTVDLDGPFLRAADSSINTVRTSLLNNANQPILCCNLLDVGQGASFNSDSLNPLIDLVRTDVTTGDRLVTVFDVASLANEAPIPPARGLVTLDGALLRTFGGGIRTVQDLLGIFRSTLTSTTTDPLISVVETPLTLGGVSQLDGAPTAGRVLHMQGSAALPGMLDLRGPLFLARNAEITTTADGFSFFNGSHAASTTTDPFISIHAGSFTAGANGTFLGVASNANQPSSSLSLQGPLLEAIGTTIVNGNPGQNDITFLFVGDGGVLSSPASGPLMAFDESTVATAGNIVTLRRSRETPTTMSLAGSLLSARDSRFSTPTRSGFFMAEGARLISTSPLPLIELRSSTFNAAPGQQAGFDFFTLTDSASMVALAGPFLKATSSQIDARPDLLSVTAATFSSTSPAPLIDLDNSTVAASGAVARVADGKLLAATVSALANLVQGSTATTGLHAVDVSGANAVVELKDLVRLTNSTMLVNSGNLVNLNGGRLTVSGNLVALAGGSTLNILNGLLLNMLGGNATIGGALVSFTGTGNTINITNTIQPNQFLGGIPIFVGANTPLPQIGGTPLAGLNQNGVININGAALTSQNATSATGSLIAVQNGATLRIGPIGPTAP